MFGAPPSTLEMVLDEGCRVPKILAELRKCIIEHDGKEKEEEENRREGEKTSRRDTEAKEKEEEKEEEKGSGSGRGEAEKRNALTPMTRTEL